MLLGAFDELVDLRNSLAETVVDLPRHTEESTSLAWTCIALRKKATTPSSTVSVQTSKL